DCAQIVYTLDHAVLTRPSMGGPVRRVTDAPGQVLRMTVGPDEQVHMMVARPAGWEAWSAPLAGGPAARELPAPWSQLVPEPRGNWRAAVAILDRENRARLRFVPPGAAIDDPGARELEGDGRWLPDGRSWLYRKNGLLRRLSVETGEDAVISREPVPSRNFALSGDGQSVYFVREIGSVRRELVTNFDDRPRARR